MNKSELVEAIAQKAQVTKKDADAVLTCCGRSRDGSGLNWGQSNPGGFWYV
jgi:hypothetical protein